MRLPSAGLALASLALAISLGAAATGAQPPSSPPGTPGTSGTQGTQGALGTRYICPMHPDVIESAPGKCPRCSMELVPGNPLGTENYRLRVEATPRLVKPGQKTRFRFHVEDPVTRKRVDNYAVVHDMPYHLFVLS